MESELLTCLLKFVEYFPYYLSALSRTLLRFFFWTTFVETAVYVDHVFHIYDLTEMHCKQSKKKQIPSQTTNVKAVSSVGSLTTVKLTCDERGKRKLVSGESNLASHAVVFRGLVGSK